MFDEIAKSYDAAAPQIPSQYVELIRRTFDLKKSDHLLDLGCGSGPMTFQLADISNNVQGLDSSVELLRLAKSRDVKRKIEWIWSTVEGYRFASNKYKLIIAYESFHLFPHQSALIQRISQAIGKGGYFCVGWCDYHWESRLQETIIQTFSEHGITWGEWGYQSVPELGSVIAHVPELGAMFKKNISLADQIDSISDIAAYLVSIEKASSLSREERRALQQELRSRFYGLTNTDVIRGRNIYYISYARLLKLQKQESLNK